MSGGKSAILARVEDTRMFLYCSDAQLLNGTGVALNIQSVSLLQQFIINLEADVRNTRNYNEKEITKFLIEGIK